MRLALLCPVTPSHAPVIHISLFVGDWVSKSIDALRTDYPQYRVEIFYVYAFGHFFVEAL